MTRSIAAFAFVLLVVQAGAIPFFQRVAEHSLRGLDVNFTQLVTSFGYPVEEHKVTTSDGYILGVFRIPHGLTAKGAAAAGKPVVWLQHGLLDQSGTYVNNLPDESLGFMLADEGYDVWFGNSRGNVYSTAHTTLSTDSKEFWEFSFDEMASLDLPACVDYVKAQTGAAKIGYVGHSQGTAIAFAGFSSIPSLADSIAVYAALAPVATVSHQSSLVLKAMVDIDLDKFLSAVGVNEFLPSTDLFESLFPWVCKELPIGCDAVIFSLCGSDYGNVNQSRIPVYVSRTPAGTSVQNMVHWCQEVRSAKFCKYDYGKDGNQQHYGQDTPPNYDLSSFSVPTALFTGGKDDLADPSDVEELISMLPDSSVVYTHNEAGYDHLDFVWGLDANTKIYAPILTLLQQYLQ
uniref:Lipase n=1 Tax=Palpitomonas bilix TaxID=652834 RepID=A0A7S3CY44_9EUKA|mmetsp:Transcript_14357/g.36621  ORF Transcript_14357/g.36621 Transcript_14357/m.36621 type:complete len:403 (+) Transcript_14357:53-1261(+)